MISGKDPLVRSKQKKIMVEGRLTWIYIYLLFLEGEERDGILYIFNFFYLFIFVEGSFKWKGNFEKV